MKKRQMETRWHKLDNTANLFPVIASKRVTSVFRLTAVLSEEIDPELLEQALTVTLPYFSAFNVRLRHGLFWSYFETNHAAPHVYREEDLPCSYIDPLQNNRFLFRMLYCGSRVHLETFHALTDGTGALRFLKAVCYRYCILRYPDAFTVQEKHTLYGTENADNIEDGYLKNYAPMKSKAFSEPWAFHVRGEKRPADELGVITALLKTGELKNEARRCGATVGEYLTAALAYAVYQGYCPRGARKPVNIFVPVDLRRMFPSETSANFFSSFAVVLPFPEADIPFEAVLEQVRAQFREKCTQQEMSRKMAYSARSENILFTRIIPLPLKNGILRIIYEHSSHGSTMGFSNLGPTRVEEPFLQYMKGFRFLLSLGPREPLKAAAIAFEDTVAITFTSRMERDVVARGVVRRLTQAGMRVTLETNTQEMPDDETL